MKNVNLYRIYTEALANSGSATRAIVSRHFDGYTVFYGIGVWKGSEEEAVVIEILGEGDPGERARIEALCYDLKAELRQESVLLAVIEADSYII